MKSKTCIAKGNVTRLNVGKSADPDDVLTPEEAAKVIEGESQIQRGLYVTLEQLENNLDCKARQRSRKTAV
jgi:hypothetical protein